MLATAVSALIISLGSVANAAVTHYPPNRSNLNNLDFVLHGSGAPGIFTSSDTPKREYGRVYNFCNMPHVRNSEYLKMSREYTLEYVEVIHRHHKRTTYNTNTFFHESDEWDCKGSGPVYGLRTQHGPGSDVVDPQWQFTKNPNNPFTSLVGPGYVGSTCQFPGITAEGLIDSMTHGTDLRGVYAKPLGLGQNFDPSIAQVRVTNNVITSQVAAGLLKGLFPKSDDIEVQIESSSFDSLEPTYPCPAADALKANITASKTWTDHLTAAAPLYKKLDGISGISNPDTGGWHVSLDHYYDNLSSKQCHGKALPCNVNNTRECVSQDLANEVYRFGNYEYSFLWRDDPRTAAYSALHYGAYFLELKAHLQDKIDGKLKLKYFHNIAHDGSIAPTLGFLQIAEMVWPGLGSEVVFELYSTRTHGKKEYFLRVLWGGQPMVTSTPLGKLDNVPIQDFFNYIDTMVGSGADLFKACQSK